MPTPLRRSHPFAPLAALIALALGLCAWRGGEAHAQGAPAIAIKVDRTRVALTDEIQLVITLEGQVDGLTPPALSDFEILGQRTEQRIDFGRKRTFSQIYTLRPKRAGTFQIGPAQATAGGRVVATAQPVTVIVEEPKALPPVSAEEALALDEAGDEPAFVRWSVPRTTFYVGEPFPLVLELWLRTELNASSPELVQEPKLDGLLVEDLKVDPVRGASRRTLGKNAFDVYPLSAQLATPLRSGKVLVDATTIRLAVSQGGFMSASRRTTLTARPFHIEIREVPSAGRPAGFSPRNIGRLTMNAKLVDERGAEVTRARTGQRMILRAEVSGQGNLVSLEAPRVIVEGDAEVFKIEALSGNADDRIEKSVDGMSGVRVFQWIVSANQPGNHLAPGLRLETFDPIAARFSTLEVAGKPVEVSGAAITPVSDQASALGEDVGPIFEAAALSDAAGDGLLRSPLYWSVLALPLVALVLVEVRHRRRQSERKDPGARAARAAGQNAKKRLRAAEQALKDGLVKDFYGQLARTLTSYFEERANIPATGMTHHEVRQAARAAGYPVDLADAWVVEMENCDFARFAPTGSAADRMREALTRVARLIDDLDRVQPERRP